MAKRIAKGRVVAVCLSSKAGVPKYPQPEIMIGPFGTEGDYHAGPQRKSHRTGEMKLNDRQVSIVAWESADVIGHKLGIAIPPGGFGENILVQGLGDLSDLKPGDQFCFEGGIVIEVTGQNDPCCNLRVWHKLIPKEAYGRRGIVGVVHHGGRLVPGEGVTVRNTGIKDDR